VLVLVDWLNTARETAALVVDDDEYYFPNGCNAFELVPEPEWEGAHDDWRGLPPNRRQSRQTLDPKYPQCSVKVGDHLKFPYYPLVHSVVT